ncbi:MAG: hypothetical protein WCR46_12215 [Deltaproteobacteria bacterium]|jgi:hypothetical protein
MRNLFLTTWRKTRKRIERPMENQDGSVILIALILLLTMSIIGFSASQTSITESFILRNTAIHAQNISLLETAALSIAERVIVDIPNPAAPFLSVSSTTRESYIINKDDPLASGLKTDWYDPNGTNRVLWSADGTTFPQWIAPAQWVPPVGTPDFNCANDLTLIYNSRGEAQTNAPMRVALLGWWPARGYTLKGPRPRDATVMAEYVSPNFGMMRLEIGIRRKF